jgi:hypothetical protein
MVSPEPNLPSSQSDWIAYHIRGMIWLKMGKVQESCELFTYGIDNTPWFHERQFFQTAMSVALMIQRKFHEASQVLTSTSTASPDLLPAVTLLQLHVCAELKQTSAALDHYDDLRLKLPTFYADVREKLFRRYLAIYPSNTEASDYAILDDECNLLLLAS